MSKPVVTKTTSIVKPTPSKTKKITKGKGDKCESAVWTTYINKVMKQVHPDVRSSENAKRQMNAIVDALAKKLTSVAIQLIQGVENKTITSRTIQNAARICLPGELMKHAVSEGVRAITKFDKARSEGVKGAASFKAGLQFPPARAGHYMKEFGLSAARVSPEAKVYMASVLEYITAEFMELSGNVARDQRKIIIKVRHILIAAKTDIELNELLTNLNIKIISGGVVPFIQPHFLKTEKQKKALAAKRKKNRKQQGTEAQKKHLPGTTALRNVKIMQKTPNLIMAKESFSRRVKIIAGNYSYVFRKAENAILSLQYYIEDTVVNTLKDALVITETCNEQTLQAKHLLAVLKIQKYNMDTLMHMSSDANIDKDIKQSSITNMCNRAGALRVGKTVYPAVRDFIVYLLENILKNALAVMENNRKKTLKPNILKKSLEMQGIYISCVKQK